MVVGLSNGGREQPSWCLFRWHRCHWSRSVLNGRIPAGAESYPPGLFRPRVIARDRSRFHPAGFQKPLGFLDVSDRRRTISDGGHFPDGGWRPAVWGCDFPADSHPDWGPKEGSEKLGHLRSRLPKVPQFFTTPGTFGEALEFQAISSGGDRLRPTARPQWSTPYLHGSAKRHPAPYHRLDRTELLFFFFDSTQFISRRLAGTGGSGMTSVAAGNIVTDAPVTDMAGSHEVITLPPEVAFAGPISQWLALPSERGQGRVTSPGRRGDPWPPACR